MEQITISRKEFADKTKKIAIDHIISFDEKMNISPQLIFLLTMEFAQLCCKEIEENLFVSSDEKKEEN